MHLSPSIESKLRSWAKRKNLSEVEIISVKELITNLAMIQAEAMKKDDLKKVKQAA